MFAINKEGESPAAKLKDPVKAENPFTTPGVPTDVKIVDFDENSVTLRWKKPATDGGREISNYIIQKKDEFGGWFEALVTTDANCCATIAELEARVPGLRYQGKISTKSSNIYLQFGKEVPVPCDSRDQGGGVRPQPGDQAPPLPVQEPLPGH